MSETRPFDLLADPPGPRIVTALAKIAMALETEALPPGVGGGLSPVEVQVLTRVRRGGEMDVERLSDALGLTVASASRAAGALAEKGLLATDPGDRPPDAPALRVTPRGRTIADAVVAWPDLVVDAVQMLEPREQVGFLLGLLKTIRQLQARGLVPLTRMCLTCRFFRPNVHEDGERPHHCAFMDAPIGDAACASTAPSRSRPAPGSPS